MARTTGRMACFLLISICACCSVASGQVGSNCQASYGNIPGSGFPGLFNCQVEISFLVVCQSMTSKCVPSHAGPETRCPCQGGGATVGKPISLGTGNVYIQQVDLRLPGIGGGLSLVRTWNSMWPSTQTAFQNGMFGPNWRSNYEERIFVGSDNYIKYARGDGSFWSFGVGGPEWSVAAPANAGATLVQNATDWVLTFKDGEQRLFDNTSGNLVEIIDRNGNTTQLAYDAVGRLTTVTGPASRHLYFSYAGPTSFLVTSVTSDFGDTVNYTYDAQGRLLQVTEPDQSTLNFDYDSQSLIADVKDSDGKILESHTYDSSGRGLSSSRANGVDAVTVSYSNQ